eukprot:57841_1
MGNEQSTPAKKKKGVATDENKDDEKVDEFPDMSDDEEFDSQEAIVNAKDLREPVLNLKYKFKDAVQIIDCIGKLKCKFQDKYNVTFEKSGTATVYKTKADTVYLLTCAHNCRAQRYDCKSCKQMNLTKECPKCNKFTDSPMQMLKARKVSFEIRDLKSGNPINGLKYDCKMDSIYIDDECYSLFPKTNGGYDICTLTFIDKKRNFAEKCKNTLIVNVKLLSKCLKAEDLNFPEYYIFGYPHETTGENDDKPIKRNEMWGGSSIDNKILIGKNKYLGKSFIKQYEVDASAGQSGAAMFCVFDEKYVLIFGVHNGCRKPGANQKVYNVSTLLHEQIFTEAPEMKGMNDLISFSQTKQEEPLFIKETPPIINIDKMKLYIRSKQNDEVKRYKIRVRESNVESKQDINDEKEREWKENVIESLSREWNENVIESSDNNVNYNILPFIKERRLKAKTEYELQVAVGNDNGYGKFSKTVSFMTPEFKDIAPVLFEAITNVKEWMEKVIGVKYNDFWEDICNCNGKDLCKLVNKIKSGTCNGIINTNGYNKKDMYKNIEIFVNGCKKLGIDERDCIKIDTFENKENMASFIINVYSLNIIAKKYQFDGPFITLCKEIKYKENDKWKRDKYIGGVNKYIGKRNGIGKMIWTNGDVYEGEWKNGKRDGYGRYMYKSGNIYYGNYKDGKRNGYGTYLYKSGSIHQGYYKDDKKSGYGKYVWSNGNIYTGNYENDKRNGYGQFTFASGKSYIGEYKDDKRHGKGKELDKDGNIIWEGQYKNDSRCT